MAEKRETLTETSQKADREREREGAELTDKSRPKPHAPAPRLTCEKPRPVNR